MIAPRVTDHLPFHQLIERGAQMHANTTSERYEIIPVANLKIDEQYQRGINELHVKKLMKGWDDTVAGVLLVSRRANGDTYVIDGQHRLEAMKRIDPTAKVPCHVYHGLSIGEEARIFHMQTNRKAINPVDRFKARVFAGDEAALDIQRVLHKYGLIISDSQGKGYVKSAAAIEFVYNRAGGIGHLDDVIRITTAIWGDDPNGIPANFYNGMSSFLVKYQSIMDEVRFIKVLKQTPREQIISRAKSIASVVNDGTAITTYARAFLSFYNHNLRTHRLPEWESVKSSTTGKF